VRGFPDTSAQSEWAPLRAARTARARRRRNAAATTARAGSPRGGRAGVVGMARRRGKDVRCGDTKSQAYAGCDGVDDSFPRHWRFPRSPCCHSGNDGQRNLPCRLHRRAPIADNTGAVLNGCMPRARTRDRRYHRVGGVLGAQTPSAMICIM